jgi:hypothetical protein
MTVFPSAAAAASWSIQQPPSPAVPNGVLSAVSCSSGDACTAVGHFVNGKGARATLAERWNGRGWLIQPTPNPSRAAGSALAGISCPLEKVCVAVGTFIGHAETPRPLVEEWDGRRWTVQSTPIPARAAGGSLRAVSCRSLGECTAVGSLVDGSHHEVALVERLDRSEWSVQAIATPRGAEDSWLSSVSCASATACMGVGFASEGGPLIERWDGSGWSLEPATGGGILGAVSCASPTACTAVGSRSYRPLAERWNGSRWSIQRTARPAQPIASSAIDSVLSGLSSVSCTSSGACAATGSADLYCGPSRPCPRPVTAMLAESWDGAKWTLTNPSTPAGSAADLSVTPTLSGVSCVVTGGCISVGQYNTVADVPVTLAERRRGSAWAIETTPSPTGATRTLGLLFGVGCTPGTSPTACLAVGSVTPPEPYEDGTPLAEEWNGSVWSDLPTALSDDRTRASADSVELSAASCSSPVRCVAVGTYSAGSTRALLADTWDGSKWTPQPMPAPPDATPYSQPNFFGVSCTSPAACTAVGAYANPSGSVPLIEQWNGAGWTPEPTSEPAGYLNAVSCASASACLAVGTHFVPTGNGGSLAESWDGNEWTAVPTPAGAILRGVSCVSPDDCTAVGDLENSAGTVPVQALAAHWDGTTWTVENTPTLPASSLRSVSCISSDMCIAVGEDLAQPLRPLAERWDGNSWTAQSTAPPPNPGLTPSLYGVSCTSTMTCLAIGNLSNADGSIGLPLVERYS